MNLRFAPRFLSCLAILSAAVSSPASASGDVLASEDAAPSGGGPCAAFGGPVCVGADSACDFTNLADAITAASSSASASTTIHVAKNMIHRGSFQISDRNVTLVGGFASCAAFTRSGKSELNGTSTSGIRLGSTLRISSTSGSRTVVLRDLAIQGGGPPPLQSTLGGGLRISGSMVVDIQNSLIADNIAAAGGGIHVDGAIVTLSPGTIVTGNLARPLGGGGRGGGIDCINNGQILMDEALVAVNRAGAMGDNLFETRGGGVALQSCSLVANASGVATGIGFNTSWCRGGAVFADDSLVYLRGSNGGAFELQSNQADCLGGGIAAEKNSSVLLLDVDIANNRAGIDASGSGSGGAFYSLNSGLVVGSQACGDCSRIRGNIADNGGFGAVGYWATGGVDQHQFYRLLILGDTRIEDNVTSNGPALFVFGPASSPAGGEESFRFVMENVLATRNAATRLVQVTGFMPTRISSSTFADNLLTDDLIHNSQHTDSMLVANSIVAEDAGTAVVTDSMRAGLEAECLMVNSGHGLFPAPSILPGDPAFNDPSSGNYRLRPDSRAIDFCIATEAVPQRDLARNMRGVDDPGVTPFLPGATYDLGAFEGSADAIFRNGFEPVVDP